MPSKGPAKKTVAGKKASVRKKVAKKKKQKPGAADAQTELLPPKGQDSKEESDETLEPEGLEPLDQEGAAQVAVEEQSSTEDVDSTDLEMVHFRAKSSPPSDERLARARDLVQKRQIADAIELYRDILADTPRNVKARNNLGVLYDELGHPELALEQFEAAEGIDPLNVDVLINYGSVLGVLARYGAAEELLLRAVSIDPESVPVRTSVGILNFRRGAYAAAELELRWVCEQDGELGRAFYYHGETLNRLGRFDEALVALEQATVLQPRNARAFYTLGHLYDRKYMTEKAALMYRQARELQRS